MSPNPYEDSLVFTLWGLQDENGQDEWLRKYPHAGLVECSTEARKRIAILDLGKK